MNKLKKIFICLVFSVFLMSGNTKDAFAVSASANKTNVTVGGKVTVTVNGKGAVGRINYTASGALNGSGSIWVENNNVSFTVTASSVGSGKISITSTGLSTTSDTPEDISFSRTINVTVTDKSTSGGSTGGNSSSGNDSSSGSNSSNGTTTPSQSEDKRSKENHLSALTVSQGTLDPKFESSKTKYNVDLPGTSKEVTISAKAKDAKAKISGIGKKSLKVGENLFKVICTAENGSQKTYTVVFHVDEAPLVYTKLGEKNLGVVRVLDDVKAPKNFKETTIKLDGQDIIGYKNDQLNMAVAYLVDESGNKDFYIIENEKVVSQFIKITISSREYYVVNSSKVLNEVSQLKQSKIKIGDIELDGWLFNDEEKTNYNIVYLMNSDGKANLYSYESTEGTLQLYTPIVTNDDSLNTMTYVFMGTTGVFAMTSIVGFVMYFRFKKKSISAIKDYYERKNQG
ncbi:MAG: cadherin-like beta sandwich domain-containing protein [Erysipelotrichales bacterium]|nr:cadherin-like beta sandwich domain-containing protein [Erysipelotrichales bacterium]